MEKVSDDGLLLFVFTATPTPKNPDVKTIAAAELEVWVRGRNMDFARAQAHEYIKAHAWRVEVEQHAVHCTGEQLQRLEKDASEAALAGFDYGIHMRIIAGAKP